MCIPAAVTSKVPRAEPVGKAPTLAVMSVLKPVPILAGMCLGWNPDLRMTAALNKQCLVGTLKLGLVWVERWGLQSTK